jgi:DNA-directed RNA polymerase subunit RPC12/RpoP
MAISDDARDLLVQRIKLGIAVLLLVIAGGLTWYRLTSMSPAEDAAFNRMMMCNECKKTFKHTTVEGESEPIECDECGKVAAYTPELCFWTKADDGSWKAKRVPTFVILPNRIDPNAADVTECPDCGREVVGHNPRPPHDLMNAAQAED